MNKNREREATRERVRRYREKQKGVTKTEDVTPDVTPLDPEDWRDRRNYSEVYLRLLDEQDGELTEASKVAWNTTAR